MDLLARLRQDSIAFAAAAVAEALAETEAAAPGGPPYGQPPPPILPTLPPSLPGEPSPTPSPTLPAAFGSPAPWLHPVRFGPWLIIPGWPDDPAEMGAVPLAVPVGGEAALPAGLSVPQPRAEPIPCRGCVPAGDAGCPYFWEDLAGELHCVLCVPIPARSMAVEAWRVVQCGERRWWALWDPGRWNLFEHLEAEEAAEAERAAARAERLNEGF